jgi:hypothetical protein
MLDRVEGESLYSIIYRTHVLHGISDFSNILTVQGRWESFPRILDGTIQYFEPIDEQVIFNCLMEANLTSYTNKVFVLPTSFLKDIKAVLYKNYRPPIKYQRNKEKIKYCINCIHEHINEYGFAIHKQSWIGSSYCEVHKKNLTCISSYDRFHSLSALTSIFLGKPVVLIDEEEKIISNVKTQDNTFFDNNSTKQIPYLAPCIKNFFEETPPFDSNEFPELFAESLEPKFFEIPVVEKVKNYLGNPLVIFNGYRMPEENSKSILNTIKKMHSKVDMIVTRRGVIDLNAFEFNVHKMKSENCDKCDFGTCLIKN